MLLDAIAALATLRECDGILEYSGDPILKDSMDHLASYFAHQGFPVYDREFRQSLEDGEVAV